MYTLCMTKFLLNSQGQLKKIPVLRLNLPYLLQMKAKKTGFLEEKYNCMHFERQNAFQNA